MAEKNNKSESISSMKLLRHLVLLSFKDNVSPSDIDLVTKSFVKLQQEIREIEGFESGINCSMEGLNKNYSHGYMLTFLSNEDMDTYLNHPKHLEFKEFSQAYIDDLLVFDFWANRILPEQVEEFR